MEHAKKNTIRVILVLVLGLVACACKLWISIHPLNRVVYSAGDDVSISSSYMSAQETTLTATDVSLGSDVESTQTTTSSSVETTIPVYICGSVLLPGIYDILPGTYLYQILSQAGGLLPEAADQYINMVFVIEEPLSIYIPSEDEVTEIASDQDGAVSDYLRNGLDEGIWGTHCGDDMAGVSSTIVPDEETRININTALQAELETLPGVGESTALAIIKYREENGNFTTAEDIMKVSGIKEGRYEAIKDLIEV